MRRKTFGILKGHRHKYAAKPMTTDDGRFDSTAEWRRWEDLKILQSDGQITDLTRDRKACTFDLHGVGGIVVCRYIADYRYTEAGQLIVEDKKGVKTEAYRLKRKLFMAEYGEQFVHRES